jgi:YD repeat-containing protein
MTHDADRRRLSTTGPGAFSGGPSVVRTTNSFDLDGRLLSVTRTNGPNTVTTGMSYTATGQLQTLTDPNGNVSTNA